MSPSAPSPSARPPRPSLIAESAPSNLHIPKFRKCLISVETIEGAGGFQPLDSSAFPYCHIWPHVLNVPRHPPAIQLFISLANIFCSSPSSRRNSVKSRRDITLLSSVFSEYLLRRISPCDISSGSNIHWS